MATRRKIKFPEELIISSVDPAIIIPAKKQIKLLDVVVDETLSFIIHAQYAASRAMQALGVFLYLRKSLKENPPISARHIALHQFSQNIFGPLLSGRQVHTGFCTPCNLLIIGLLVG
jgi:hypothetical protein